MLSSPKSRPLASNIPRVKELRVALGFRDPSKLRSKLFNDKLRAFRREYHTRGGVAGTDLHHWRSREDQTELSLMAHAFFSAHGQEFWPDDGADEGADSGEPRKLRCSKDKLAITIGLKRLIFRQNQQEYRNAKYKGKDKAEEDSNSRAGDTNAEPIDLDDDPNDTSLRPVDPTLSLRQSARKPSGGEIDPRLDQSAKEKDHPPALGLKQGPSGAKRTAVNYEQAHSPSKRQRVREHETEVRKATPPPTPSKETVGERSSGRSRQQTQHPGFVAISRIRRSTFSPTRTPTVRSTASHIQTTPIGTVEDTNWELPRPPSTSTRRGTILMSMNEELRPDAPGGRNTSKNANPISSANLNSNAEKETPPLAQKSAPQNTVGNSDPISSANFNSNADKGIPPLAQQSAPKQSTPSPAMRFKVTYLVKWPGPQIEIGEWHPEGAKFLDMTLEQVILELSNKRPLAKVTSLVVSLCLADGDDSQPRWRMQRGEEDAFNAMKKRFRSQISTCLKESNKSTPLSFEMEIEPLCGEAGEEDRDTMQDSPDNVEF